VVGDEHTSITFAISSSSKVARFGWLSIFLRRETAIFDRAIFREQRKFSQEAEVGQGSVFYNASLKVKEKPMLTAENLPQDVRDALPEEAQKLYMAAYNSFYANSQSENAAARVAWQTIELNEHYARTEDGKWYRKPEQEDGGSSDRPLGSARGS
jgi:cation transport regulator